MPSDLESDLTSLSDHDSAHAPPERKERSTSSTLQHKASLTIESPKSPKVIRTYLNRTRPGPSSPASPLVPLSTPPSTRNVGSLRKRTITTMPNIATPSKRQRITLEDGGYETSPSQRSSAKRQRGLRQSKSSLDLSNLSSPRLLSSLQPKPSKEEAWDLNSLGPLVWVRINKDGEIASAEDEDEMSYWWPAKTSDNLSSSTFKVKLLKPLNTFKGDVVSLQNPLNFNIQSRLDGKGQSRFNAENFIDFGHLKAQVKGKFSSIHITESWTSAVQQMDQEDLESNDGLPSTLSALLSDDMLDGSVKNEEIESTPRSRNKGKKLSSPQKFVKDEYWSAPPPDPLLEIPGERILAREKKNKTEYWPARILSYTPPSKPSEPPKYRVQFLDNFEFDIARDMFFTSEQDGFATCKLGTFQSVKTETEDDHDNDEEMRQGSPSPEPRNAVPSTSEYHEMSIREQFCCVKSILRSILNDDYAPAKERHDAFIKGGQKRIAICENAGATGELNAETVEELSRYLTKWVLGDVTFTHKEKSSPENSEAPLTLEITPSTNSLSNGFTDSNANIPGTEKARSGIHDRTEPSSSLFTTSDKITSEENLLLDTDTQASPNIPEKVAEPNDQSNPLNGIQNTRLGQVGCAAYEALSITEKLEYCANVLLPEAMIQILSWRSGYRQSLDVLSAEEEARIHLLGQQKLEEIDWVNSIVQLRRYKEKELAKHIKDRPKVEGLQAGTRSRPKNTH